MESANLIKIKKANSHTYRRLRKIAALTFRSFELFLFVMVVSRFTTQLPVAFRISADYFTGLSLSLFRPGPVFLIGNAIILLLFLISGSSFGKQSSANPDYYEDYVKRNHKSSSSSRDKQKIIKVLQKEPEPEPEPKQYHHHGYEETKKIIQRSQSENRISLDRGDHREEKPLSRTLTETGRKVRSREDEMSSEEFQQTVENFIARQQRLLREELFG